MIVDLYQAYPTTTWADGVTTAPTKFAHATNVVQNTPAHQAMAWTSCNVVHHGNNKFPLHVKDPDNTTLQQQYKCVSIVHIQQHETILAISTQLVR